MKHKWMFLYPVLLLVYTVYSYTQTDPNLVLSSNTLYWNFQQWAWQIGYHNRTVSAVWYMVLMAALALVYLLIVRAAWQKKLTRSDVMTLIVWCVAALLFSYPALSHDIFNYLFNAKMVLTYHANPHTQVALDFYGDDWTRFMHNTHTVAPYGYGFTAISLIPSFLGFGHLTLTLLWFRLMMVGAYTAVLVLQQRLAGRTQALRGLVLFALNPLILIEMIGSMHNDLIMMALALLAVGCVFNGINTKRWVWFAVALVLFAASVSIKYATLAMLGGVGLWQLTRLLKLRLSWAGAQVVALLTPLLTARSQWYLPWYLSWSLVFVPLAAEPLIREGMIAASIGALFSYVPFLYRGEYTPQVLLMRSIWCFVPAGAYLLTRLLFTLLERKKKW